VKVKWNQIRRGIEENLEALPDRSGIRAWLACSMRVSPLSLAGMTEKAATAAPRLIE